MLLKDLQPGDLFQFKRKNGPRIHRALNGAQGMYRSVGFFVAGEPKSFCHVEGCVDHEKAIETDRPERAVTRLSVTLWPLTKDEVA